MSESALQKQVLQWLELQGVFCWRNNSGAVKLSGKTGDRFLRYGYPGSPDIIGSTNDGQFFGVELKSRSGRQTDNQKIFQRKCEHSGGLYILARSLDDVMAHYETLTGRGRPGYAEGYAPQPSVRPKGEVE